MSPAPLPEARRRTLRLGARLLPALLLAIQMVLCFQLLRHTGRLDYQQVPDARSYLRAAKFRTLEAALSSHRTLGYPTLLRALRGAGLTVHELPRVQAIAYFAAVALFALGLAVYSGSRWLALVAATPLVWSRSHEFLSWAQTDSLAISLTVASFGCLLLLAARPRSLWAWGGVALGLLAAYQVRPATLFLVGLVPLLAVVLRACHDGARLRALWRWGLALAAATVLPYLLFATLRWAVVGHFGLVAFGGANLIGITASFIDPKLIDDLPPEEAVLARWILQRREARGWQPKTGASDPVPHFRQYNDNVWKFTVPLAHARLVELTADSPDPVPPIGQRAGRHSHWIPKDRMMLSLSREIIRLEPYLYLDWVLDAWAHSRKELAADGWLFWLLVLLGLSLPFAWLYGPGGGRSPPPTRAAPGAGDRRRILVGLLVMAGGYFLAYMALVCLVSFPISRYTIAGSLFLPPLLVALLFEIWRRVLGQIVAAGPEGAPG